jgi:hypothetical protein
MESLQGEYSSRKEGCKALVGELKRWKRGVDKLKDTEGKILLKLDAVKS